MCVLAVVSGRPVSFISKLYEPKYVPRQTVELPEDRAAAPVVYGGAVDELSVAGGRPGAIGGLAPAPGDVERHGKTSPPPAYDEQEEKAAFSNVCGRTSPQRISASYSNTASPRLSR